MIYEIIGDIITFSVLLYALHRNLKLIADQQEVITKLAALLTGNPHLVSDPGDMSPMDLDNLKPEEDTDDE